MLDVDNRSTTQCVDCGEELRDGMKFCPHCGGEIDATTPAGESEEAPTVVLGEAVTEEQSVDAPERPARPRRRVGKPLAIGLATLLVAGGAYAGYTAYLNHREYKAAVAAAFGSADGELSAAE